MGFVRRILSFFVICGFKRVPTDYASLIEHLFYVEKLRCFWTLI
ncbi:hypothetical protein LEP1GSC082_1282 [Leptospira kirschneri str. H2]|uniref:Uncharacterized protein n=1 Tax=Leptospira kirschneri serovar Bulgarica str. Nikolaevo TaxID=1240687 RepID=M6FAY1_9LEPT|nr:hypothetical protein LEP1GSC082_1282 [Leptospira kirschneri str. H2]EMK25565.1 hypothetical protein LEP1GSC008_0135 [Leptospira kirschneri serovar Bulgarica str. Nikolaevo]